MHLRKLAWLATLAATGAFVACTLNPQPLPPNDNEASSFGDDASTRSDGGTGAFDPETPPPTQDAAPPVPVNAEGGADGDAGDGGDAGPDASDGGDAGPDAG